MKVLKSFMYGSYGGTAGDNITIKDKDAAKMLIEKGILEPEKSAAENVKKSAN